MKNSELQKNGSVSTETNRKAFKTYKFFNKLLALMPIKRYINCSTKKKAVLERKLTRNSQEYRISTAEHWYTAPLTPAPGAATFGGDWVPP